MGFTPRMQSETLGFDVVSGPDWRAWNGIVADVWDVRCSPDAGGAYLSPDPRLFVLIESEGGGSFDIEVPETGEIAGHTASWTMSYLPAGLPVRSRANRLARIRHLDIHFDEATLVRRFGRDMDRQNLDRPRLSFHDPLVADLARLIAAECASREPMHELFGGGLVDALLARLFDVRQTAAPRRPALSRNQLRQATAYIEAHCLGPIRLASVAAEVGLSESYFSHAFKAATGVPPHRWQMQARVRHVQRMMRDGMALKEVAAESGFADQAHLTRVFRTVTGMTPSQWIRDRAGMRGK